jgi:hypothetical protein
VVIGLGTGVTAGELTLYPGIHEIDVAEISPSVVKALPYFAHANRNLHRNRRVKIHIGDAFRILTRGDRKWDIIISEPTNPWVTGVDLLFTEEFYRLVNRHLNTGGILLQWIQRYSFNRDLIGMILNTLIREFSNVRVFNSNNSDLLVIATNREWNPADLEAAAETFRTNSAVRSSLGELQVETFTELLLRECWNSSYIRYYFLNSGIQSMDYPRLHYRAGKVFFMGQNDSSRLYDYLSTPFRHQYLLADYAPEWLDSGTRPRDFSAALAHSKTPDLTLLSYTPLVGLGYLNGTLKDIPDDTESRLFHRILPLITGETVPSDAEWEEFSRLPLRRQIEMMFDHLKTFQSWLLHYPVDGLLELLSEEFTGAVDPADRRWLGLQWLSLLLQENRPTADINLLLSRFTQVKTTIEEVQRGLILNNHIGAVIRLLQQRGLLSGYPPGVAITDPAGRDN